jgi:hypothetical protein
MILRKRVMNIPDTHDCSIRMVYIEPWSTILTTWNKPFLEDSTIRSWRLTSSYLVDHGRWLDLISDIALSGT